MLSVNKKFHDEKFFRRVIQRKYPYLIEFKKKDETWKFLFLRMVHAIGKLQEEYGIPYIPIKGYNPVKFYRDNKDDEMIKRFPHRIYDYAMMIAARGGCLDIVKQMIAKGASELKAGMKEAAEGGYLDIVEFFIRYDADEIDLDYAMSAAGAGGNLDIVKYLADRGASDFGYLLFGAAEGKHLEIMKYAAEKGISNSAYDTAIEGEEDPNIANYLRKLKTEYGRSDPF